MAIALVTGMVLQSTTEVQNGLGQTALNDWFYAVTGTFGSSSTDQAAAAAVDSNFAASYKALCSSLCTYWGVRLRIVAPTVYPGVEDTSNSGLGTNGATNMPGQVAGVMTKGTGQAGRKMRGRCFGPFPPPNAASSTGEMTAGYVALLNAVGTAAMNILTVGGAGNTAILNPCLYHRTTKTFTLLTTVNASTKWGTQRRRGDYGRPNLP
jgi:hypothetical protein